MHPAAFLPLVVLPFALAKSYDVKVGVDKDGNPGLYYTPDNLSPVKGDTVVFSFSSDQHSVAQSTFDKPCEYVANGLYSGFPGPGATFTVAINNTDPIWLFCSHPEHCQRGQVLVLNEPKDKTLAAYKNAAQSAKNDGDNDAKLPVVGGVVALADSASATSASATASATKASASASASSSVSATQASASSAASTASPTAPATSSGAASKFNAGTGLGAVGLLGFLVGGMI